MPTPVMYPMPIRRCHATPRSASPSQSCTGPVRRAMMPPTMCRSSQPRRGAYSGGPYEEEKKYGIAMPATNTTPASAVNNSTTAVPRRERTTGRGMSRTSVVIDSPVVADYKAGFHHEPDTLHFTDVHQRVAGDRDDVRELSFFDAANVLFPVVVQHRRGW